MNIKGDHFVSWRSLGKLQQRASPLGSNQGQNGHFTWLKQHIKSNQR